MEKKEMNMINENELDQVSGGSNPETRELADFINAHGGNVSYGNNMCREVDAWLVAHRKETGLAKISHNTFEPNEYRLFDEGQEGLAIKSHHAATHEEVMARLRSVYGE